MYFKKMRPNHKLFALILFCFLCINAQAQAPWENRSVPAWASIDKSAPYILLTWNTSATATGFTVYRRAYGTSDWGTAIATLGATDTFHLDKNVSAATVYEYAIKKGTSVPDPFYGNTKNIAGYAYLTAAIEKPATHKRGNVWLLVSKLISDSLPTEVAALKSDLSADGWMVFSEVISADAKVADIKTLIKAKNSEEPIKSIYLLGHIPVPYAGLYCADPQFRYPPDGHAETDPNSHCGAWAADVYYGDLEGLWTDDDSTTLGKREANKNLIGDGKFDNSGIPGEVTVAVGRVDFSRLPRITLSEVALTRNYLNKVHDYKTAVTKPLNEGIIQNNFAGSTEGFSSGAVHDFSAVLGENKVKYTTTFLTDNNAKDYLLGYACAGGDGYDSMNRILSSASFNTKNGAAFNHLFGSFFGDFDSDNNLLRASLASTKLGYATIWSGRPKWVTHPLALGETYGDVTIRSQNNNGDYDAAYFQNQVHMALLGDPTLRHDMIIPPTAILLTPNSDKSNATVTWTASTEPSPLGYFVYRSHRPEGRFILLNTDPVTATTYTDNAPYDGSNYYMVKTAKEITTGSGSYINVSLGISDLLTGMKGDPASIKTVATHHVKVYPTLAQSELTIAKLTADRVAFSIFNTLGSTVKTGETQGKTTQVTVHDLNPGVYFITVGSESFKFVKQ
jgi:hypothetical protein